ncbi:DUF2505 domain-containing protein [Abyssibacter profundi]|uniref:DUF2505 domain-containing protein n=1 Tax=Abyssibacter profundi TaxID=2182787 RepID=A0A363UME0_9GAMM|nr:DUF2505 domain-containing protein [Abyssibacter profundi]PWN56595.1 hypothetical protein DEH80_07175 [Abyssibacter profundi]
MKFQQSLQYNKPSDEVIQLFGDPSYFERKFQKLNALAFDVLDQSSTGDQFSIKMKLTFPLSVPVPGFAKKVVGDTTTLIEQDSWDLAAKTGTLSVDIQGAPVKAVGQMKLVDQAGGCVNEISWDISCSVPLIGKKIEKLIADDIQAKGADDARVTNELLADNAGA